MRAVGYSLLLAMIAVLAGCAVGPDYHTPSTTLPSDFGAAVASTQPAIAIDWWRSFGDPELDSLIDRALAANFDLEIALAL